MAIKLPQLEGNSADVHKANEIRNDILHIYEKAKKVYIQRRIDKNKWSAADQKRIQKIWLAFENNIIKNKNTYFFTLQYHHVTDNKDNISRKKYLSELAIALSKEKRVIETSPFLQALALYYETKGE